MRLRSVIQHLPALLRARPRKCSLEAGRALIEFRNVSAFELTAFEARLRDAVRERPEIESLRVDPLCMRVLFFVRDGHETSIAQLEEWVQDAESSCRGSAARSPLPEHELADDELEHAQRWVELLADLGALGVGFGLKIVPFVPERLGATGSLLVSLVVDQRRLRAPLDRRLGRERAELFLNLLRSACDTLSRRPLSSAVVVGHRVSALRELQARTRLFRERRAELDAQAASQDDFSFDALYPARPVPAPKGPLEAHRERAFRTAGLAFGLGFLTTRSVQSASAALFSALPQPAHLGREIFANEVGRVLAEHGTLVLAPSVLRRLDRVDCLVIDGRLLAQARYSLGDTYVREDLAGEARARIEELFDSRRPLDVQESGAFRLGPMPLVGPRPNDSMRSAADTFSRAGSLVLGLLHEGTLAGVVEVKIDPQRRLDEVLALAQASGLRVVVASDHEETLAHLGGHRLEFISAGGELQAGIARLQREGHTVCYLGKGPPIALRAADCGVAVGRFGQPHTRGADLLCSGKEDELRAVLRACLLARAISEQSVSLAIGAAALGTVASASGKTAGAGRRVMWVVNAASLLSMVNALQKSSPLRAGAASPSERMPWHALEAQAVLARLGSTPAGLSEAEAARRLHAATGRNTERDTSLSKLRTAILEELKNPLAPLLAAGSGLSAMVGSRLDASLVAGAFGVNALVGGVQRYRAERAIAHLIAPAQLEARVRRDGRTRKLKASELVLGDVILLSAGDEIPANCRVLESNRLEMNSSSLTGESMPIGKDARASFETSIADRSCMLYAGTRVVSGSATAVVVALGDELEVERAIPKEAAPPPGGVETRLRELMTLTGPVAAASGAAVIAAGLLRGRPLHELVESGVSMAVAAIPEGLPLLATAAQLSTVRRLAQRDVLVRNARCVEAMGRVDVICLDKTGTLTEGRVELHRIVTNGGEWTLDEAGDSERKVLAAALRASAERGAAASDNPLDEAVLVAARRVGVERDGGLRLRDERPFESARGYHAVLAHGDEGDVLSVKGAPERVLELCTFEWRDGKLCPQDQEARRAWLACVHDLAAQGLRVIAVAERRLGPSDPHEAHGAIEELCLLGLLAFRDAARSSACRALVQLRRAGVRTVMLTGDHVATARAIAAEVGLLHEGEVIEGGDLMRLSDDELDTRIDVISVFARVTPGQKVRIVRALQRKKHVVAMVGDGSNDAPALRTADVGIAVGGESTTAARAAADIVLARADLEALHETLLEARAMWLSVRDAVAILLGGNLGEIAFTALGGLLGAGRPPLSPRQLLLVNFLTDIAPAMAIAVRKPTEEAYAEVALAPAGELLQTQLSRAIGIRALSTGLGATWAYGIGRFTGTRARASTMALTALVGSQLGQTLLSRGQDRGVTWMALASSLALGAVVQTPGLSHLFGCRPLGPVGWGAAVGCSVAATSTSALLSKLEERLRELLEEDEDAWPETIFAHARVVDEASLELPEAAEE